jgi:hypothetical protein
MISIDQIYENQCEKVWLRVARCQSIPTYRVPLAAPVYGELTQHTLGTEKQFPSLFWAITHYPISFISCARDNASPYIRFCCPVC